MSIHINRTVILKLTNQEYNFIMFIRNKLPFGKCVLFTRDGMPIRIEQGISSVVFNNMGLDFSQEEKTGNSSLKNTKVE